MILARAQDFVWNWQHVSQSLPFILKGLKITVAATMAGMLIALVLGLVLAMLRRMPYSGKPAAFCIEFIRSTPLLIQLYFVYYVLPAWGITMGELLTGIIALGIHYSSYTAEVYRAGLDGIAKGQFEACRALNLSPFRTYKDVIIPQAIPPVIPALGNYLVAMFKDTPLLSSITVLEMLKQATNYSSRYFSALESYTLVGVIFLLLSLIAAAVIRCVEAWLALPTRENLDESNGRTT